MEFSIRFTSVVRCSEVRGTHDEGVKQATLNWTAKQVGHQEVSGLVLDYPLAVAWHHQAGQAFGHRPVQQQPVRKDETCTRIHWRMWACLMHAV